MNLKVVLQKLRHRFEIFYGDRLARMVLFGSRARGDAKPASDIDVLVVLNGPVNAGEEIERTGGIVSDLCLESEVVISCVFLDRIATKTNAVPCFGIFAKRVSRYDGERRESSTRRFLI